MTWDGKAFGQEIVGAVKAHVSEVVGPILKRLEALEAISPEKGDRGEPGKDGAPGVDGKDGLPGKDAELTPEMVIAAVKAMPDAIMSAVAKHLEDNPVAAGKDGRDGLDGKDGAHGKDGSPGIDGKDGAPGRDGNDGKDGCGVKDLLIDRDGKLIATMDDGRMKELGVVVGKDGATGRDGKDGSEGLAGKDGADGVGFDDLDMETREDGVYFVFTRGDIVKEARIPVIIDCGVWKEGRTYHKGNGVTWGGQFWISQEETTDKPDTSKAWRLAVKKGRDGKDYIPPGKKG